MPLMAARGYWNLGAIGCRGASWSEQLDGKELRGEDSRFLGTVFMASHSYSYATMWYTDFQGLYKSRCTAVTQKRNTPYSSVFLSRSARSCIGISHTSENDTLLYPQFLFL